MSKSVGEQLVDILDEVGKGAEKAYREASAAVAKDTTQRLKNTSPKRPGGGDYARGWRVKKLSDNALVIHNATNYQLTHLLENGHVVRNAKGIYGRARAIPHIAPAEQWASSELPMKVMEGLDDNL